MRPRWMIRAGLFLYDNLARRNRLAGSRSVDLSKPPLGAGLRNEWRAGFTYADCWVDDARLVISNAIDARERGADIRTRCKLESARRTKDIWEAELSGPSGQTSVRGRILVNAAGPWVGNVIAASGENSQAHIRLIKGSHIVVPRLYTGDHAFILQNTDRRVVFAIPYEGRFTLIGTTDVPYEGDAAKVAITAEETKYLCAAVGRYFAQALTPDDVVWSYAGVRPLYDDEEGDPSAVTRDYVLELEGGGGRAPMLSVFGGKITTYRRLAEEALQKLSPHLAKAGQDWTATAALPGGDIRGADFAVFLDEMRRKRPWLADDQLRRMTRSYGSRLDRVLGDANSVADLGADLGAGLSEREAAYLVENEWARTADDILWRRSKLGLHGGPAAASAVANWLEKRPVRA
jgi:glycerol-3-phosphate dehydrogenase